MSDQFDFGALADALVRDLEGVASGQDHLMIEKWLHLDPNNKKLYLELKAKKDAAAIFQSIAGFQTEAALSRVHQKTALIRRNKVRRIIAYSTAVAAATVLIMGLTGVIRLSRKSTTQQKMIASTAEIGPAKRRAQLILPGGAILPLVPSRDSAFNRGGANVKVSGDAMSYLGQTDLENVIQKVFTPNGTTFKMALSDGTQVWLNAGSWVKFPAKFSKAQRLVEVSGEVYFEVASEPGRPFVVTAGGTQVQVLGTAFNLRAYAPQSLVTTTLLQGAVQVGPLAGKQFIRLSAGEQAVSSGEQVPQKLTLDAGELRQVSGWRSQRFIFKGTKVREVLEEIARWYDVEVVYEQGFYGEERYHGEISREVSLNKLCSMLETTGAAHLQIQGRKLLAGPVSTQR